MRERPRLTIGIPVFNGERFLQATLESILSQSYEAFDVIISDDASSDGSVDICQQHARRDTRIQLYRNAHNSGAATNFNRVCQLARTELFKWCAQDDLLAPTFIERCVDELNRETTVIAAYAMARTRSPRGVYSPPWGDDYGLDETRLLARWRSSLTPPPDSMPLPLFSVFRSDVLRRTSLLAGYPDCDRALLSEISLYGRIACVEETLMTHREHGGRAGSRAAGDSYRAPMMWLGAAGASMKYPHWSLAAGYLGAIRRAPLEQGERVSCYASLGGWLWRNAGRLAFDVAEGSRRVPGAGTAIGETRDRVHSWLWGRRTVRAAHTVRRNVPTDARVIVVDGAVLDRRAFSGFATTPFVDGEGREAGDPPDGAAAVDGLRRAMTEGATHLAICWPARWWLGYYRELRQSLEREARLLVATPDVSVWELTGERGGPRQAQAVSHAEVQV